MVGQAVRLAMVLHVALVVLDAKITLILPLRMPHVPPPGVSLSLFAV